MNRVFVLSLFLALSGAVAHAEGESSSSESDAERAIKLSGRIGLTGFQDMVDARTPAMLSIRGGARYDVLVRDADFSGTIDATVKQRRHEGSFYVGASFLGLIDAALRVPFVYDREERNLKGLPELKTDNDHGWGNLDLAAKVTLKLAFVSVAPYAVGKLPTGETQLDDLAEFEYGAAAAVSLFNDHLSFHANLAGLQVEKGLTALRFRAGVAFVAWASDLLVLRAYGYADGIEYEGRADSDIDLEFGLQGILFELLSVELGFATRLLDANYLDDTTKDVLRRQGVFDRHFEDDGTWQVHLAVGIVF